LTREGKVIGWFYLDSDGSFLFEKECDIHKCREPVDTVQTLGNTIGTVKSRNDAEGQIYDLSLEEWKRWKGKPLRVNLDNGRTAIVQLDPREPGPVWGVRSYFVQEP
jgi:hypothetical protein